MPQDMDEVALGSRVLNPQQGSQPQPQADWRFQERLRQARARLRELPAAGEPFFFHSQHSQLFGCYHAPVVSASRGVGVVLCYPIVQEYLQAHRAIRQLAIRLAGAGFRVLRFDYYGTGDSEGDAGDAGLARWRSDLDSAIQELRNRGAHGGIHLIGLRLGASLAAIQAAERGDISRVVLWEPVVAGRALMEELETRHADTLRYFFHQPDKRGRAAVPREALGFPMTDPLLKELESVDLMMLTRSPSEQVLVIEGEEKPSATAFVQRLKEVGCSAEHRIVASPQVWTENVDKGLVPRHTLESIVSWLSEGAE